MKRVLRYALSAVGLLVIAAAAALLGGPRTQAATGTAPVTVVNVPLPVTLDGTASISGAVTISGTPNVRVTNFPQRTPYHFELDAVTDTGTTGRESHTIPSGSTLAIEHVACNGNTTNETDHPLRIYLTRPSGLGGTTTLVALTVNALQHGTQRFYNVTQEAHAFLGAVSGSLNTQETVTLDATIDDSDVSAFVQCYVSGELIH